MGSRARADERKILRTLYTLQSHIEGTNFGTHKQEGTPAESKSDIRADYGQQQWWVPTQCGCYRRQGILWSSTETTHMITQQVYSMFQCPGTTQQEFSQYSEDDDVQSGPDPQTKQPPNPQWMLPSCRQKSLVHTLQGAQEERMTVKHHTSMTFLGHSVFPRHISQRLSHCLWCRLTNIMNAQSWQ
jgi:hypothetical protein